MYGIKYHSETKKNSNKSETARQLIIKNFCRAAFLGIGRKVLRPFGSLRIENPDGSTSIKVRIFKA